MPGEDAPRLSSLGVHSRNLPVKHYSFDWLPPRDSNPDMLLQRQLSYH